MPSPVVPDADLTTTDDTFLGGALQITQPARGYRAGLDAVLLAAACPTTGTETVLDCGAGVGTVGLAVARRVPTTLVTLVERDPALAAMATQNASRNGLDQRCRVITADLTAPLSTLRDLAPRAGTFDHVLANPPYYAHGSGTRAPDPLKDGSHAMAEGTLADWARFAAAMTREGGTLTIIHRPDALPEILAALDRRFGGVRVLPLYPRPGQPASRVLLQAFKGSRAPLTLLAGRILHNDDGHGFTPEFDAVLRDGEGLQL